MQPASLIESGSIAQVSEFPRFQLISKSNSGMMMSWISVSFFPSFIQFQQYPETILDLLESLFLDSMAALISLGSSNTRKS